MSDKDQDAPKLSKGVRKRPRLTAQRAAEMVKAVRGRGEQPFGPFKIVRSVIRPKTRSTP